MLVIYGKRGRPEYHLEPMSDHLEGTGSSVCPSDFADVNDTASIDRRIDRAANINVRNT
jgi:hypothetical protein